MSLTGMQGYIPGKLQGLRSRLGISGPDDGGAPSKPSLAQQPIPTPPVPMPNQMPYQHNPLGLSSAALGITQPALSPWIYGRNQ